MKQLFFLILLSLSIMISCTTDKEPEPESKSGHVKYQNNEYPISKGYIVKFSELDCGNRDVFAYGIYLTDGIEISKKVIKNGVEEAMFLVKQGKGNICCVNLFCKSSTLLTGTYTFVDAVQCSEYSLNNQVFTFNPTDKLGAREGGAEDQTNFAFDVDLTIGWENILKGNEPTSEDLQKVNDYLQKGIHVKSGTLTVAKDGTDYKLTISCITNDGKSLDGEYKGPLSDIEFEI